MDDETREFFSYWVGADQVDEFVQELSKHGYIKLPGNAQNVTITTSDNAVNGKLMTEQEWREKFNG